MNGTISIGGAERPLSDATPNWINEQLGSRKDGGGNTCVRVAIHDNDVNVALATRACTSTPGGTRPPNQKEAKIIQLWSHHRLGESEYPRGQLVAFVEALRKL